MKRVIINADDFGYSTAVNEGILKSYKDGILTSTTLMANMPGSNEAIKIAKKNPKLGVGGHLVLTCGKPLTKNTSITNHNGEFYNLDNYRKNRHLMKDKDIFQEWSCQIEYLLSKGIKLTHLDSHHHVHTFQENLDITRQISEKYKLCFRNAFGLENNIKLLYQKNINGFLDLMNHTAIRDLTHSFKKDKKNCLKEITAVLEQIKESEITELMVHPAFVDEELFFGSSFNIQRIKETTILCSPEMKELIKSQNITLYNFRNI